VSRGAAFMAALAAAAALGTGLLAGCGSGGETTVELAPAAVRVQANANCRQLRHDAVKLAEGAFEGTNNLAKATTEKIVKPSIPLLERFAQHQQRLAAGSGDERLELYARLFEPVIVLAQERLRAGEESDAPVNNAARGFEILMGTVIEEQRQLAREAKIPACAVDFEKVLRTALRG
jgi:outer membrane murein-binding lipoprotein Lpp